VDVVLGVGDNAVFSKRWKAFALGHHLLVNDCLIFRLKLGTLKDMVWIFDTNGARCIYPLPVQVQ
jgi:hypothetical protein